MLGRQRLPPPRVFAIAIVAGLAIGLVVALTSSGPAPERALAQRFVSAWQRGDFATMYDQLSAPSQHATSITDFADAYRAAFDTATGTILRAGKPGSLKDGHIDVPIAVTTRVFGTVRARLRLPITGSEDKARIAWSSNLTFPGVAPGTVLTRDTHLPLRADLDARDGQPLAQGPGRTSPLGAVATAVVGKLGPPPPAGIAQLRQLGYPSGALVGVSGLEKVFQDQLAGRPGGDLLAGSQLLARTAATPGPTIRTTIDPAIEQAAVTALGPRLGGVAALRPRTGEILALAGIAFSGLQPPGSTFKIVTLTGVLAAHLAGPHSVFAFARTTQIEGVEIQNADGESCGGSLESAFVTSCNSTFAPLGVRLGAQRLVQTAEQFGFNSDPHIPGAATSTIPAASEIGDNLAIGSSAIGQGRVQATALQMAWVASTIANRGKRVRLTLQRGDGVPPRPQVIDAGVARQVGRYMVDVVNVGTGTAAAIPGVRVAGKTGTAELKDTSKPLCEPKPDQPPCPKIVNDPTSTDAWFAAYAPAGAPKIAVGVLLVHSGRGGDTAAPAARGVLQAGLR